MLRIAPIGGGRERFGAAMRHLILVAFLLAGAHIQAGAQEECEYGGEKAFNSLVEALSQANSCSAAVAKFKHCAWGSSADTRFGSIVVEKCEKSFLDKLSPAAKERYEEEKQLCAYRYARREGTMWMAVAAGCQVDVAAQFAANPAAEDNQPARRASFDCEKAQTALEKAICSDIRLGHADIVLSRAYSDKLKNAKEDRPTLVRRERQWLQSVPAKCGVTDAPLSQQSLNCVRNEFEERFTMLDSCFEKIDDCSQSRVVNRKRASAAAGANPRASFDCEKASTSLESVICADAGLGQTDIKLAEAYRNAEKAMATQHQDLVESERQWLHFVNGSCPMSSVGSIPPDLTRRCVEAAFETRIVQLQTCSKKQPQERISCLNDFQLLEKK